MTYDKNTIEIIPYPTNARAENLTGHRFHRLTVLGFAGRDKWRVGKWWCECECGNITKLAASDLRSEHSQSCGCLQRELLADKQRTHGRSQDSVYSIWCGMIVRCYSPNYIDFAHYGGRGITVCDRWRNSFVAFLEDMHERPSPKHSVERQDTNGNYEPDNCIWATSKEQNNNKRNNRLITLHGVTRTVTQWAEELGCSSKTLFARIYLGWDDKAVLTIPVKQHHSISSPPLAESSPDA
jgi:hypothetical protein